AHARHRRRQPRRLHPQPLKKPPRLSPLLPKIHHPAPTQSLQIRQRKILPPAQHQHQPLPLPILRHQPNPHPHLPPPLPHPHLRPPPHPPPPRPSTQPKHRLRPLAPPRPHQPRDPHDLPCLHLQRNPLEQPRTRQILPLQSRRRVLLHHMPRHV